LRKRTHRSEDDIYVTQMAVYVPKKILHAHQDGYNLEESLNDAIDDIEDQLKKYKEKTKA
jgi:ribosome-associated translation inhibitor RaiA